MQEENSARSPLLSLSNMSINEQQIERLVKVAVEKGCKKSINVLLGFSSRMVGTCPVAYVCVVKALL